MAVEITLLGPPRVMRDGEPVAFDTRKAMALLAHLALADRPRPREALCELLWPNHDLDRARGALRRTLSTLRRAIGEERLDTTADSVALVPAGDLHLDVARFRELAAPEASPEQLGEAVAVFSGEFLEGFFLRDSAPFEHWQRAEGEELARELGAALRSLVAALATRGHYEAAVPHAKRWLGLDSVHEPAHQQLIRLYAWAGNRGAALEQYRLCVRTLGEELGVAPLDETVALYEQLESGTLPAPTAEEPPPSPKRGPSIREELPLVGRADDLATLVRAHASAAPDGALAVIEGEAGIGKTRLATEIVERTRTGGGAVLVARCHEDEAGVPYGPVIELLREALRQAAAGGGWPRDVDVQRLADASLLLPELAGLRTPLPDPTPLDAAGASTRLLEATTAVIAAAACSGTGPGIVFLDDAHAADEATAEVMSYLGRRLRERPIMLLIAWRTEGMLPGNRLRRLAVELELESRAAIVAPARLDPDNIADLVRATGLSEAGPEIDRRLYLESEGLPFFVAEYLAVLRSGGDIDDLSLPREIRGLLDARLAPLEPVARQVLGAAAVIGGAFELDTLREASGRSDEETVGALEALMAQGLVREAGRPAPAYEFSHQKLRALVNESTSPARRQLLHRRAARAIAKRGAPGESALVAHHLRRAGDHTEAAAQFRIAAEHAALLHANAEAIEHLEAALALGHPDVGEVHERLGDLRTLRGDYGGALASFESAAAHARPEDLAPIEHKLGGVHERRGDWDRAEAHFVAALSATPETEEGLRARIQADRGLALHRAGGGERAAALTREALTLAESAGDRRGQAQAHNLLGILARHAGDLDDAAEHLSRSLDLAKALGDDSAQAAALNNRALVSREAGDLDAAMKLTETALELCARQGDRHREAALENNLADIHHAAGRPDESMEHLKRAVGIFSEVGADEDARLPEVWKLVSW